MRHMVATQPLRDDRVPDRATPEVVYPDSDGQPMSDNTLQFAWIVYLKENLDTQRDDFVAGDLLWYPIEGRPDIRIGPDVLVAVGRPKGYRGSYKSWVEGQPPTVVFEVLSPSNSLREMMRKAAFYKGHGARELIVIDPEREQGWALCFGPEGLDEEAPSLDGWVSPSLGIRFAREDGRLRVYGARGEPFLTLSESQAETAREADRAAREAERAAREAERATREAERATRLADKLRALGVDPDA